MFLSCFINFSSSVNHFQLWGESTGFEVIKGFVVCLKGLELKGMNFDRNLVQLTNLVNITFNGRHYGLLHGFLY